MRYNKYQNISIFCSFNNIGYSNLKKENRHQLSLSTVSSKYFFLLTTFSGNMCLGRYFTFSCVSLMISVNLRPSISSSKTHIETCVSNCSLCLTTLCPMILAMADPLDLTKKSCKNSFVKSQMYQLICILKKENNAAK